METAQERPICKKCGSKHVVKNGGQIMKQNWLCRSCGVQFIENLGKRGLDERDKRMVENLLTERISVRGIARTLEVSRNCIRKYIKTVEAKTPEPEDTLKKEDINFESDDI